MGSPSSTMGTGTKLLLGLAFLGLVLASPLPQPLPLPRPFVEPFGLIGRLLGLQGSGTLNTLKKPKPFKPEEECICERTFHKKPDKKKKKPKKPCDCYGAPESGYGVPSQPPLTTYTSPCKPEPAAQELRLLWRRRNLQPGAGSRLPHTWKEKGKEDQTQPMQLLIVGPTEGHTRQYQ